MGQQLALMEGHRTLFLNCTFLILYYLFSTFLYSPPFPQ